MDIKIEAQTVVANEGGFEPHPESYTPRVFAAVQSVKLFYERVFMESFVESAGVLLDDKQQINTAIDPELEDLMREAGRAAANILHTRYPNAVSQADGDCSELPQPVIPPEVWDALKEAEAAAERESGALRMIDGPEDVTWIGEIDGKRYAGLGKPKSGTPDHLPEGGH
jgi:hypothetical protein